MARSTCRQNNRRRESAHGWSGTFLFVAASCLLVLPEAAADEAAVGNQAVSVNELEQASLQRVFRLLSEKHVRAAEIDAETVNRAALQGLLRRFHSSAELVEGGNSEEEAQGVANAAPTLWERLSGEIAYLRLALADRTPGASEIRQALEGATWLLVDLRVADGCDDFGEAARFLSCFAPSGQVLFELQGKDRAPGEVFRSGRDTDTALELPPVVVFVDSGSSPAAEVIAGWLGRHGAALIAGAPTAGAAVRSAIEPITEGLALRFAEAEVVLPGGQTLHGSGVHPALLVPASPESKEAAFPVATQQGVAATISQPQRPRLNESALVTGIDPQLAGHLAGAVQDPAEAVQDVALRQLIDLLVALDRLGLRHPVDGNR